MRDAYQHDRKENWLVCAPRYGGHKKAKKISDLLASLLSLNGDLCLGSLWFLGLVVCFVVIWERESWRFLPQHNRLRKSVESVCTHQA